MNESRRMQYLDAMGIDMFVPRFIMPNAPTPKQCILPVANDVHTPVEPSHKVVSVNDEAIDVIASPEKAPEFEPDTLRVLSDGLNSVLADLDLDKPLSKKVLPAEAVAESAILNDASESAVVNTKASFNLTLWFTDCSVQVIDSRNLSDALPVEALLSNLLRANGMLTSSLPSSEVQVWPFPGSQGGDQSWTAACGMMADFFEFRFERKSAQGFIVMGEPATKALLGEASCFDDLCFKTVESETFKLPVTVLPALRDLLYSPADKRQLWMALKPQRQR